MIGKRVEKLVAMSRPVLIVGGATLSVVNHGRLRMIEEDQFTNKQRELYELMSEISEDCNFAGWLSDNERAIWSALQDGSLRYGGEIIDKSMMDRVRELSNETGGWIIWMDDSDDALMPIDKWGPRFVTIEEWNLIRG